MTIVGIDEVGRGCWAGPLVACATTLHVEIDSLKDSKLLSKKKRQLIYESLLASDIQYGLGWVSASEVDAMGLSKAVKLAMQLAYKSLNINASEIIIDGNINFLSDIKNSRCEVRADITYPVVSAASILAKQSRDAYMIAQSRIYPGYGFDKHVGYGTKKHIWALENLGLTPLHRMSYKPVKAFV